MEERAIDIVIPTSGRLHIVTRAIASVAQQCYGSDRIFVVVQGKEKLLLDDKFKELVNIVYLEKPNLPIARNTGVLAGKNPIVFFIDDDCIAKEGLLEGHRNSYTDDTIAAVGGGVEDPIFGENLSQEPSVFDIKTGNLIQNFSSSQKCFTISLMGCNMSFRREILERIGGFDNHFLKNAMWEEIDISFRIILAGYKILFNPAARVLHKRADTGGCRERKHSLHLYHYFANTTYFIFTYAPYKYIFHWLKFWLYRLEYFTRYKKRALFKHKPVLAFSGILGMIGGMFRFMLYGKRRNILPYFEKLNEKDIK